MVLMEGDITSLNFVSAFSYLNSAYILEKKPELCLVVADLNTTGMFGIGAAPHFFSGPLFRLGCYTKGLKNEQIKETCACRICYEVINFASLTIHENREVIESMLMGTDIDKILKNLVQNIQDIRLVNSFGTCFDYQIAIDGSLISLVSDNNETQVKILRHQIDKITNKKSKEILEELTKIKKYLINDKQSFKNHFYDYKNKSTN